jgi:protein-S-isoprenylcysteine O-methyltransferase Ste14
MFKSQPMSTLQYCTTLLVLAMFFATVFAKRRAMPKSREKVTARSRLSIVGVAVQSFSFVVAAVGLMHFDMPSTAPRSMAQSAAVLAIGFAAAILFSRSARALGANWSIVARTRLEHGLVRHGPFAYIRHPIYLAMLLLLVSVGIGFGNPIRLLVAIPLFVLGTSIRVREEERLLRQQFGNDYVNYASETPAFIPKLRLRG